MSREAPIKPTGTLRYALHLEAKGANLTGTTNPVPVMPAIGDERHPSVKARISHQNACYRTIRFN